MVSIKCNLLTKLLLAFAESAEKEAEERRQMESGELLACNIRAKHVRVAGKV